MVRRRVLKWMGLLLVAFLVFSVLREWIRGSVGTQGPGKIAMIHILGPMISSKKPVELLARYRQDASIKAIILRIDTPGGGVGVAQEIVREMQRAREQGKFLMASLGSVAASGGYYVASAADWIMADPGTMTGSIGVIVQLANLEELLKKIGVHFEVVKSGPYKDVGNFSRRLTKPEERLLQDMIDDVYGQFVNVIVEGRFIPIQKVVALQQKVDQKSVTREMVREAVLKVADGMIFSGAKAVEYGLVDGLGNITDAVEHAAKAANIPGIPEVVEEHKKFSLMEYVMGETTESLAHRLSLESLPLRYQLQF